MQKSYGISIPEKEKIQTDIDSLRNHINWEKNDESDQEDDVKDRTAQHMHSVNMHGINDEGKNYGKEGIAEETQMDGPYRRRVFRREESQRNGYQLGRTGL